MEFEIALAAINLVEKLYPKIEEAFTKGEITDEQALALHNRVDALRNRRRWKPEPSGSALPTPPQEQTFPAPTPGPVTGTHAS